MKKYIIIISLSCFILCTRHYNTRHDKSNNCIYNYSVSIGKNISINKAEVETAISSVIKHSKTGSSDVEIIIFSNSSGKEVYSYSDNIQKEVTIKTQSGEIEALVKIRFNNALQDVIFLKATGNNKKEILQNLAQEVRKALCK